MTKTQETSALKEYAQSGLIFEYGFAPSKKAITLLEAFVDEYDRPQYVRFEVGGHEYSFDGITLYKFEFLNLD